MRVKFLLHLFLIVAFLISCNCNLEDDTIKSNLPKTAMIITKQGCITERIYQKPDNDMFRKK